jgi:hypothetical protein
MKKKSDRSASTKQMLDNCDIITAAHLQIEKQGRKQLAIIASNLLGMVDLSSGSDVAAIVSLLLIGSARLSRGHVRNGKLVIVPTADFARDLGGDFEVAVSREEAEIIFGCFNFPDHWDAGDLRF